MTTETIISALRAAREIVHTERTHLADAHMSPVTNQLDADGQAGVAEYDVVLRQIDDALAASQQPEPTGYQVWWGVSGMRPLDRTFPTREEAEACAAKIRSNTEVRPLYASPQPAARQPEHEGMSRGEWTAAARRVYLAAGDDEATAKECASYLWSEQDHLNCELECPYEAALADIDGRPTEEAAQQLVAVPEGFALPEHETEAMHDAVMAVLYTHGATRTGTDLLWQAYRAALLAAAPQAPSREPHPTREDLIAALTFYAEKGHFQLADEGEWDTVSGEPPNFWCDSAGTATIEDGSLAKLTLEGKFPARLWADDGEGSITKEGGKA